MAPVGALKVAEEEGFMRRGKRLVGDVLRRRGRRGWCCDDGGLGFVSSAQQRETEERDHP